MDKRQAVLLAALALAPMLAAAQEGGSKVGVTSSVELGKVTQQTGSQVTATVEAVDKAARTVTLKGPEGNLLTVAVGEEVRNFEQIRVGDRVEVRYTMGIVLQLVKGGGALRTRVENETVSRAPKGEKPAGTAVREVLVVADIVGLDPEKQTVTLRGPERTVELRVRDRAQFENLAVGDQVEATFTEAAAISVQIPSEKQ